LEGRIRKDKKRSRMLKKGVLDLSDTTVPYVGQGEKKRQNVAMSKGGGRTRKISNRCTEK